MIGKRSVTERTVGKECVIKTGIQDLTAVNPNCAMVMTRPGPTINPQRHPDTTVILIR